MLEKIINPKRLIGLALIAYVGLGPSGCSDGESCQTGFDQTTAALMGSGKSEYHQNPQSEYGQKKLGLNADGCRDVCYPVSEDCCWCPD